MATADALMIFKIINLLGWEVCVSVETLKIFKSTRSVNVLIRPITANRLILYFEKLLIKSLMVPLC